MEKEAQEVEPIVDERIRNLQLLQDVSDRVLETVGWCRNKGAGKHEKYFNGEILFLLGHGRRQ